MRKLSMVGLVLGSGLLVGCALLGPRLEAILQANPTSGSAPLTVLFTLGATRQGSTFTFTTPGANVALQTGSSLPATVVRVYPEPGTYVATLVVEEGTRSATTQVGITVTAPPAVAPQILTFDAPQTVSQLSQVQFRFTARAGGAGRKLGEYRLWFGDGEMYSEPVSVPHPQTLSRTITHVYAQRGSYTATLRVYDDLHHWAEEKRTVAIEEAP